LHDAMVRAQDRMRRGENAASHFIFFMVGSISRPARRSGPTISMPVKDRRYPSDVAPPTPGRQNITSKCRSRTGAAANFMAPHVLCVNRVLFFQHAAGQGPALYCCRMPVKDRRYGPARPPGPTPRICSADPWSAVVATPGRPFCISRLTFPAFEDN
jgi:hypothetical protein